MLIDAAFGILILLACVKGFRTGIIVGLFSIIAFIAGLAAALKLSAVVAIKLSDRTDISVKWLPFISFVLIFLIVVILVSLGARFLQKIFEFAMLGWVNRIGGIILFILLYSIVFSIFLFYAVQLHIIKDETIQASQSYSFIKNLGPGVINKLGTAIPFFKDMFEQLQEFFGSVANKLRH